MYFILSLSRAHVDSVRGGNKKIITNCQTRRLDSGTLIHNNITHYMGIIIIQSDERRGNITLSQLIFSGQLLHAVVTFSIGR